MSRILMDVHKSSVVTTNTDLDSISKKSIFYKPMKVINGYLSDYTESSNVSFEKENIDLSTLEYDKYKSPCSYCGYGNAIMVMFKDMQSNEWIVIRNWCGCLSYGPSYTCKSFDSKQAAHEYFENSN